jgi:hypothetical protein
MDNDPRYAPVAATLPQTLPPIDRRASVKYAKKLVRHFGRIGLGSPNQRWHADLARWGWTKGRRVWISSKPTTDHYKGWGRLIHDVSHLVFRYRHPSFKPHDGGHATLEREMAEYAVAKGWLTH